MNLYDIQPLPEDEEDLNAPAPEPQIVPMDISPAAWDEDIPVPAAFEMRCHGCGHDLTGVSERTCPACERPFYLAIPESFQLHCPECDYLLTGLTTRVCPECGTGFDVKGLLFARRHQHRHRIANRWPWEVIVSYAVGVLGYTFGAGLMSGGNPGAFVLCTVLTAGPIGVATMRGADLHISVLWAGLSWGGLGLLVLAMT